VSTKPDVEVAWYHGQTKISLTDDVRYRMDSENCLYRLVIMGVVVNDAGDWRCLATNSYGQCISACRLDVIGKTSQRAGSTCPLNYYVFYAFCTFIVLHRFSCVVFLTIVGLYLLLYAP